jgi:hypothetical protein
MAVQFDDRPGQQAAATDGETHLRFAVRAFERRDDLGNEDGLVRTANLGYSPAIFTPDLEDV